ncbi:hypothetical protein [Adlercreutzia sp. ZJ304]|uniref:hypothetical protein n=1 Tax=Adlercreutzia sp. ZJ304 TaxID=2709791 RepID=UPI0013E9A8B8|nr:hypothetical protein [Adlercreutzia sp. ZJ304]
MPKARNKVIAGAYKGKIVSSAGMTPYIILKLTKTLNLDKTNVSHLELIDESSDISVASAATRGFIGEMLLGPIELVTAGTAKRDERYIVDAVFKDGQRSVLEIDGDLYRLLAVTNL